MEMTPQEQKIHYLVLADSAASYLKVTTRENIVTNAVGRQEHEIGGKFPDLIAKFPSGEIVVEAIETESTANQSRLGHWQELASLGYDFRLAVPLDRLEAVKSMVAGLKVNIQAYEVVDGKVHWFGTNT